MPPHTPYDADPWGWNGVPNAPTPSGCTAIPGSDVGVYNVGNPGKGQVAGASCRPTSYSGGDSNCWVIHFDFLCTY